MALIKAFENEDYHKEFIKQKSKKLPRGFEEFVNSELAAEFIESIHNYCIYFLKIEAKK